MGLSLRYWLNNNFIQHTDWLLTYVWEVWLDEIFDKYSQTQVFVKLYLEVFHNVFEKRQIVEKQLPQKLWHKHCYDKRRFFWIRKPASSLYRDKPDIFIYIYLKNNAFSIRLINVCDIVLGFRCFYREHLKNIHFVNIVRIKPWRKLPDKLKGSQQTTNWFKTSKHTAFTEWTLTRILFYIVKTYIVLMSFSNFDL